MVRPLGGGVVKAGPLRNKELFMKLCEAIKFEGVKAMPLVKQLFLRLPLFQFDTILLLH